MKNYVSINLKKDEIIIKLSDEAEQKDIIYSLRKKLPELKKLYKDEKTPIKVVGKVLKNKEIDEIQKLIKSKIDVEIEFDMPKSLGLHSITKTFEKEVGQRGCIGSIAEIYDSTKPYNPKGAIAQGWSVAEILRIVTD